MDDSPIEAFRSPAALRHQRRAVLVERAGWVGMLLLIVAALAGLLGPGPLSHTSSGSSDGSLEVDFSRFLRSGATTGLDISLTLSDPSEQPRVRIDADYLDAFSIDDVRPAPAEVIARGDQLEFVFAAPEAPRIAISFDLTAQQFGRRAGTVEVGDSTTASITQFIYP
ncbi:MAG: hypothetical protein KG028_10740 [Actinobacteria bacterium]|nr:hypothetical protein [Actinomycetota bacterium]